MWEYLITLIYTRYCRPSRLGIRKPYLAGY